MDNMYGLDLTELLETREDSRRLAIEMGADAVVNLIVDMLAEDHPHINKDKAIKIAKLPLVPPEFKVLAISTSPTVILPLYCSTILAEAAGTDNAFNFMAASLKFLGYKNDILTDRLMEYASVGYYMITDSNSIEPGHNYDLLTQLVERLIEQYYPVMTAVLERGELQKVLGVTFEDTDSMEISEVFDAVAQDLE